MAEASLPPSRKPLAIAAVACRAAAGGPVLWHRAEQRKRRDGPGPRRGWSVLSATFKAECAQVGEVEGAFDVTSIDPAAIRDPALGAEGEAALFATSIQLDLSEHERRPLSLGQEQPDAGRRGARRRDRRPNVDGRGAATLATRGVFVDARPTPTRRSTGQPRRAPRRLPQAGAGPSIRCARAPTARQAIARNASRRRSKVAGMGNVKVVVALPAGRAARRERWDVSPSIAEVLASRRPR